MSVVQCPLCVGGIRSSTHTGQQTSKEATESLGKFKPRVIGASYGAFKLKASKWDSSSPNVCQTLINI